MAIVIFFSLFFFIPLSIHATSPSVHLTINPSTVTKKVGERFTLQMIINNLPADKGISGFDICLDYDPTLLSLSIDAVFDPVDQQNTGSTAFTPLKKHNDAASGSLCLAYVVIAEDINLPKSATVPLTFQAKKPGQTKLTFSQTEIVGNVDNHLYDVVKAEGLVTIQGKASFFSNPLQFLIMLFDNIMSFFKR